MQKAEFSVEVEVDKTLNLTGFSDPACCGLEAVRATGISDLVSNQVSRENAFCCHPWKLREGKLSICVLSIYRQSGMVASTGIQAGIHKLAGIDGIPGKLAWHFEKICLGSTGDASTPKTCTVYKLVNSEMVSKKVSNKNAIRNESFCFSC